MTLDRKFTFVFKIKLQVLSFDSALCSSKDDKEISALGGKREKRYCCGSDGSKRTHSLLKAFSGSLIYTPILKLCG